MVKGDGGWVVVDDAGEAIASYPGRGKGKAEQHASALSRGLAVEPDGPDSTL